MSAFNYFRSHYLQQLLFWLLLFAGWHFFRYQDYPPRTAIWITALKVVDLALLVTITNAILIPRLLYRKRYWIFGLVFILLIFASSLLKMYLLGKLMNNPGLFSLSGKLKGRIYDNVLPHILLVSTGAAFKLLLDQVRAQKRLAELAKEKAAAELNFLKSQINPHFVFNSLNAIYFLIDKSNSAARSTLLRFSDMLRYQLYDCSTDKIDIGQELKFLEDYVHLQQLRRDAHYKVSFVAAPELRGLSISPLLLIPFVENAFKHLSHRTNAENFVRIELRRNGNDLLFEVVNSQDPTAHRTEPVGGIGLVNVKRRLELLYPGQYELKLEATALQYQVQLKLGPLHTHQSV